MHCLEEGEVVVDFNWMISVVIRVQDVQTGRTLCRSPEAIESPRCPAQSWSMSQQGTTVVDELLSRAVLEVRNIPGPSQSGW